MRFPANSAILALFFPKSIRACIVEPGAAVSGNSTFQQPKAFALKLIQNRLVQDPSMSDAEFLHQKARAPHKPHVGMVYVQENAVTRIGGLAYIKRRMKHHEMAAERFKSMYESMYGSGSPATDAGRVQVDTTVIAHDSGMAARVDRSASLRSAMEKLGKQDTDRIIAIVVLCAKCSDLAPPSAKSGKPSGRAVVAETTQVLNALNRLAEIWGYLTSGSKSPSMC